jgi:hypothetical protein
LPYGTISFFLHDFCTHFGVVATAWVFLRGKVGYTKLTLGQHNPIKNTATTDGAMHKKQRRWSIIFLLIPTAALSQTDSFRETAQRTLLTNPEVQVRFHSWQAAKEERAAAAGGYFPRVDVTASSLQEERRRAGFSGNSYRADQASVTLTQMLFDGICHSQ